MIRGGNAGYKWHSSRPICSRRAVPPGPVHPPSRSPRVLGGWGGASKWRTAGGRRGADVMWGRSAPKFWCLVDRPLSDVSAHAQTVGSAPSAVTKQKSEAYRMGCTPPVRPLHCRGLKLGFGPLAGTACMVAPAPPPPGGRCSRLCIDQHTPIHSPGSGLGVYFQCCGLLAACAACALWVLFYLMVMEQF